MNQFQTRSDWYSAYIRIRLDQLSFLLKLVHFGEIGNNDSAEFKAFCDQISPQELFKDHFNHVATNLKSISITLRLPGSIATNFEGLKVPGDKF